jgi:hypothetical protein
VSHQRVHDFCACNADTGAHVCLKHYPICALVLYMPPCRSWRLTRGHALEP